MEKVWSFSSLEKFGKELVWFVSMENENNFPDLMF